ncbi:MAG: hypothetical protein ACREK4_07430 [Candidatus Rokuibacteriota bacterium]
MARYAAQVAQWLREDPAISAVEILRRAQAMGYNGGKSALYELVRRVRTLDERPGGSRQLVVVAPDREHLYNFFRRAFEGNATVQVVRDRRAGRPEPEEGAPRQRNRRSLQSTDGLLRAIGWTIVRLRGPKIRRSPASAS